MHAAIQAAARDLGIGEATAARLVQRIRWHLHRLAGGDHIYIPRCDPERNDTIRALSRAGQPPRVLAARFALSESRIRQILRRTKESHGE